jgi:selenocysteine lyase/cysteine desulfurase
MTDARRFEAGNFNWAGIAAANASLGELLQIGRQRSKRESSHSRPHLRRDCAAPVDGRASRRPGIAPTHIVTAGTLGAGDTNSSHDPKLNRIGAAMTAAGVKFTMRKGMLRFGFHCYNDETDVERVLEVVRGVR